MSRAVVIQEYGDETEVDFPTPLPNPTRPRVKPKALPAPEGRGAPVVVPGASPASPAAAHDGGDSDDEVPQRTVRRGKKQEGFLASLFGCFGAKDAPDEEEAGAQHSPPP